MNVLVLVLACLTAIASDNRTDNFPDCKLDPLATFPICDHSLPAHERLVA